MKRYPFVLGGTVVGVAGVLAFRSSPAPVSLPGGASAPATSASATSSPAAAGAGGSPPTPTTPTPTPTPTPTTPSPASPSASSPTPTTSAPTTTATTTTTTTAAGPRSSTGPQVNYYFGVLSVKVTVSGSKLTAVTIGTLNDGGNYRSQSIDQYAIPILEQQALAAQSANIQGVSGASYTSAGFAQSLQGALKALGL